ncbi:MAG: hypothetical protein A2682_02020 [Candidatus Terrybacteria bacterium RIFCSPHIGHO2_01_FULL_58_15]|uniref:PDZ domain-containing protein n=1 Tax=Terrybacteria sp. (strain RIFCSPHIGHO2_01_FULL_58_15) TaxID=1802363 RepID=A0A1G2PQL3_TERXR|nr:MAG: hypothetical protein A2682_02020 [Candidatus Terrybacteria bacterium RIFCSPHIGHO2_01_FULL_58_15]
MPRSSIVTAIKRALPAVVSIRSIPYRKTAGDEYEVLPEDSGYAASSENPVPGEQSPSEMPDEGLGGSGVIIAPDGLIVTNKHVIANLKERYEVLLPDGRWYPARILARDPATDVAFLRVRKQGFLPIALGSARSLELGDMVIAIGNALGQFTNTASAGIVSGLSRSLVAALDTAGAMEELEGLIQTDAAINPGNSGGPLVNLNGEAVGINVASVLGAQNLGFAIPIDIVRRAMEELEGLIQTDAAINPGNSGGPLVNLNGEAVGINVASVLGAQNLGFAIPIDIVRRDMEELRSFGRIRRVYLGIRYMPVSEELARTFHLPVQEGALIASDAAVPTVIERSAAHRAGLRPRDVILEVNGEAITTQRSLAAVLSQKSVGEQLALTVLRGNRRLRVAVTPTEWQTPEEEKSSDRGKPTQDGKSS